MALGPPRFIVATGNWHIMSAFDDIEEFRKTDEAQLFADQWLQEQRTDIKSGDKHMDLLMWQKYHPHQALGIILTLLDRVQDHKNLGDDDIHEIIAGLLVDEIVEFPADDFVPVLIETIKRHPAFEFCTRGFRLHSSTPRWHQVALGAPVGEPRGVSPEANK